MCIYIYTIKPCFTCGMNRYCPYCDNCHYCDKALCKTAFEEHMKQVRELESQGHTVYTDWKLKEE